MTDSAPHVSAARPAALAAASTVAGPVAAAPAVLRLDPPAGPAAVRHGTPTADELFDQHRSDVLRQTDRLFAMLMICQWAAGIVAACVLSPRASDGSIHPHVWAAVVLGGLFNLFPAALAALRPGATSTRYVVSCGQAMASALGIHLTGGRIETHFHVFGSLAFLAFYRDWRVLMPFTVITAADHFLRGVYFPQSMYGVLSVGPWRWLEHAGWVVFEDVILIAACVRGTREMRRIAEQTAEAGRQAAELAVTRETALDCIVVMDFDGRIREFNPAAERTFGHRRADVVGRPLSDVLIPPRLRAAHEAGLAHFRRTGEGPAIGKRMEIPAVRADGTEFPAEIVITAVRLGGPPTFVAYMRDITERTRAAEQARHAEKLALVASRTDNAVVITDPQGLIEWVNDGFTRVTGYGLAEVKGRKPGSFLQGPDTDPRTVAHMSEHLARGQGCQVEVVNYGKNGVPYWLAIEVQPVRDPDGTLRHFMAIESDVTERKRMERELRETRERFELAVRGSNDGLWDWDLKTGHIFYSPRWLEQVGYADGELPPTTEAFDQLLHPADADRVWGAIADAHADPAAAYAVEFRLRHKDGRWRWILSRAVTVFDAAGAAVRMAGCHTDVTEKRDRDAALRVAEEKYRGIFENSVMGIFQTTPEGRYLSANAAMARIYGYDSTDDLLASVVSIRRQVYVDPERRPQFVRLVGRDGQVADFESEIFRKDGSVIWISENARAVRDPATDAVLYYEGTIQDITERKAAEAGLRRAIEDAERARASAEASRAEAERANVAKSQFLANMSHEIRTPLNGVIGMAELLVRRGGLTEQQLRYATVIQSSADTLLSLINDVLDFSKIEAGKLELSCVETDLRAVAEDVVQMLAPKAAAKGLEFACHVAPDVPARVQADPDRLRQILINLANNAIKFTKDGEVVIRATAEPPSPNDARRTLRFAVTDTGLGIPPDRMDRLFKSFSQVDASTTRKFGGTGLGLAIVKQLVELMGGEVGVQSEVGKGSTFWFTARLLPVMSSSLAAAFSGIVESFPAPGARAGHRPADVRGTRVLAVDDNPAYREILREQFAGWGFAIAAAADGEDALRQMRAAAAAGTPFNVAVVDMLMPGINGIELARLAKAEPPLAGTALLMLTSLDNPFSPDQMRSAGFAACLTKPVRQSQLFDTVMEALAGRPHASASPAAPQPAANPAATLAGVRVLLAEDNEVNQEVARELLAGAGCAVDVVGNGLLAVRAVGRKRYDVVLMDCQMPEMDGFEAARGIRQLERAGSVLCDAGRLPIIALTANAIEGDRQRCLSAGMDGYVTKPIDPDTLERAITEACAARRAAAPPAVTAPPAAGNAAADSETAPTAATVAPAAAAADDAGVPPLDVPALLKRCRGKASLAEKLLAKFEEQLPQQLAAIRDSMDKQDLESLARLAHTVKGSAANLSADPLRDAAAAVERLAAARDAGAVADQLSAFAGELERCLKYLPAAVGQTRAAPAAP